MIMMSSKERGEYKMKNCIGNTVISSSAGGGILWAAAGGSIIGSLIMGIVFGYWIYKNETEKTN